jgi:carnitine O-acetyltransferase
MATTFLKASGYSPDAFVQMAIQVATFRLFGKQAATYESTQYDPFYMAAQKRHEVYHLLAASFVTPWAYGPSEIHMTAWQGPEN